MITVVGDAIIDKYIEGTASRLSPEAPVPVLENIKTYSKEGGALNVFNNIQTENKKFVQDERYVRPVKTRVIANSQQIVRFDEETPQHCQPDIGRVAEFLIISDYSKGAISNYAELIYKSETVLVDAKRDFERFSGADILKCNSKEFREYTKESTINSVTLGNLSKELGSWVIVTDSDNGAFVYDYSGFYHVPAVPAEVVDVTGAGDVFLALLGTQLYLGESIRKSVQVAVRGATLSVAHRGTYILSKEEYEHCLH